MALIFFGAVALVSIATAVGVIAARNSVHSALLLVVNLFTLALLYLTMEAEFIAAVQVLIYAGGIMVLFLFVITLLDPARESGLALGRPGPREVVGLGLAGLLGAVLLVGAFAGRALATARPDPVPAAIAQVAGNTQQIGLFLYSRYLFPFEVTSILLLVAMVGAVVLARRRPEPTRPAARPALTTPSNGRAAELPESDVVAAERR
ncbi:MAG: NADH-quinone oxidoreductase subunit J [Chloroflexi bacterium]|nr:NADH-quinone oxidoreductase subunit J [Chloroflexota bacterium]